MRILALFLLLACSVVNGAAPSVINGPTFTQGAASAANFTVSAGANRKLFYFLDYWAANTITSITYGGQAMTRILGPIEATSTVCVTNAWELNEAGIAAAGSTVLVVTYNTGTSSDHILVAVSGANQAAFAASAGVTSATDVVFHSPSTGTITGITDSLGLAYFCNDTGVSTWTNSWVEATDQNGVSSATKVLAAGSDTASVSAGTNIGALMVIRVDPVAGAAKKRRRHE